MVERVGEMVEREPIIIDTDPGIDDFFAIIIANACKAFDIRAITPVSGNQDYSKVVQNALDIVDFLGMNCPVTKGAEKPLIIKGETSPQAHGETGLGFTKLPRSNRKQSKEWAWDAIYREAKSNPGKLHIIAIGPLTNIAIAILKYPELTHLIGKLTIMGGSANFGNHSPYGEFNIWVDPHAAAVVFRSGIKIKMFGLDGNATCKLSKQEFDEILAYDFKLKKEFQSIIDFIFDRDNKFYAEGPVIHDAITVASLVDDTIMEFTECYTDVETKSSSSFGRTVVDVRNTWGKEPNSLVAVKGDKEKCKKVFLDSLLSYR